MSQKNTYVVQRLSPTYGTWSDIAMFTDGDECVASAKQRAKEACKTIQGYYPGEKYRVVKIVHES